MKVGVYTICKNEKANVEDWVRTTRDEMKFGDTITVCDTGSTDGTVEAFLYLGMRPGSREWKIGEVSIDPWRFDDAHNAALAQVPDHMDMCIPLHLDERLQPGWRDAIEAEWRPDVTKLEYQYEFAPTLTFWQNRIHARKGYRWLYPDHEGVYPYGGTRENTVRSALKIVQKQSDRDRSGTLARLAMGVAENPTSARMRHYYGRELMYRMLWRQAVPHLEMYLRLAGQHPVEQQANAECLSHCYRAISQGIPDNV